MTIEIKDVQVEQIVNDAVLSGRYRSVQDVLSEAVFVWRDQQASRTVAPTEPKQTLLEFFRKSPLVGLELDIKRDEDPGRDVPL